MKYVLWAIAELAILRWLLWAVRKRIPHEMAVSLGALLGVALWFEAFMSLLTYEYATFRMPGPLKTIGWALLWLGAVLAIVSMLTLRLRGKPTSGWEHTTQLIETGIYRWVRHPLYLAGLVVVTGIGLLRTTVVSLILWASSAACLILAARFEDRFNGQKFGKEYRRYQARSKLLIPFLF